MPRRSDCPRMRRPDMDMNTTDDIIIDTEKDDFSEYLLNQAIDADGKRTRYSDTLQDEDAVRERRKRRDNARSVLVIHTKDYLNDL